jgi:hypothetical protein
MSFVHRLIVGHFDIGTLVWRPVPLRSLDVRRTRAMLEEIAGPVGEGEYIVEGDSGNRGFHVPERLDQMPSLRVAVRDR